RVIGALEPGAIVSICTKQGRENGRERCDMVRADGGAFMPGITDKRSAILARVRAAAQHIYGASARLETPTQRRSVLLLSRTNALLCSQAGGKFLAPLGRITYSSIADDVTIRMQWDVFRVHSDGVAVPVINRGDSGIRRYLRTMALAWSRSDFN